MINKIIEILKKQEENLRLFYKVSMDVQKASVQNNIEQLEKAIHLQEQALSEIRIVEKQRLDIFERLKTQYLKVEFSKISELLEILKGKILPEKYLELQKTEDSIKKIIVEIQKITETNRFLISHSRNFLKETLTAFLDNKNRHLLDRRM